MTMSTPGDASQSEFHAFPAYSPQPQMISIDHRRWLLSQSIMQWQIGGWQVESSDGISAVMFKPMRRNHVVHAILSIITFGFYLIIWLIIALTGSKPLRAVLTIDEYGYERSYQAQS